ISPVGSFLASVAFMWSGFFFHWHGIVSIMGTLCWSPLILYFVRRCSFRTDRLAFHGLSFALLAQFLGSHSQSWLFNLFLLAVFFIWELARREADRALLVRRVVGALILSGFLAAPQVLPFYVTWQNSPRANQDEAGMYQARNRLSPRKIVTLAVPDLFGGTEDNVFSRLLLKSQPEAEGNIWNRMLLGELGSVFNRAWGYIGLIPLLLSLIGSAGWRKEPHTRIWTVLGWGTLGLLVLLGIGPAHRLLSGFWKTIDVLDHTRAIYFTVLSLSVLSGFGHDRFQTGDLSEKAAKIAIGFGILILALI